MHKDLFTCQTNASLGQIAALLARHHVHALIVVDQNGKAAGIISDFDLLAGEWLSVDSESLAAMRKMTARDLMTAPVDAIDADASAEAAARIMIEKQIHRMLVTEKDVPIGVISISDFVASIAQKVKATRETVGDVMSDTFLVCRDKTPIISVARTMTEAHFRSVLVVDAKGRPKGVVTGRDILRFAGKDVNEDLTVSDIIIHPTLITVDMNASLHEAADLMIQNHLHRVIVVDKHDPESFPLGVISSFDIVAEMARPGSVWQS